MSERADLRARRRIRVGIGAGVFAGVILVGWLVLRSTGDDEAASSGGAGSTTSRADPTASRAHRGATGRPPLRAGAVAPADDPQGDAEPPTSLSVPLPERLGGGKPVATSTAALADRLQLMPAELTDLAEQPGGELPPAIVRGLEDAQARGTALGERLGLDAPEVELVASRFTNQLLRIERQLAQSPQASREEIVEMVTRDTLEDLRRNLGEDVAKAAEGDVRGLPPLR